MYKLEEVKERALHYFNNDDLAANVWIKKYALKDKNGNLLELSPTDMHERITNEISRIETKYGGPRQLSKQTIFELLNKFKYIVPQGRPMAGIGNTHSIISLSNCFVIGNEYDSYGSILKTDQEQVQLMKRGGGVGHDLSHLRANRSLVNNAAGSSSGPVSYAERYSNSTREVAQDGRRGALMLSLSINHPDAEAFIDSKMEQGKITGANISVRIDNEFMTSLYDQTNPNYEKNKSLWNKIIHNAWKSAEPGILFWDTIINESIPDCYKEFGFKTTSTNPCGEIPLCPYDSCRLLAINLYNYVDNPFTESAELDYTKLSTHAIYATRIMDDIIDLELEKIEAIINKVKSDPEPKEIKRVELDLWYRIRKKTLEGRRAGIGITAEGDMLAALGLRYGTEEATKVAKLVHQTITKSIYAESCLLGQERGNFKVFNWELEKENPFIKRLIELDPNMESLLSKGRRHIALLTIAPTGTVSLMTQTTSGIENLFMPWYKRRRKMEKWEDSKKTIFVDELGDKWEEFFVLHKPFIDWYSIKISVSFDEAKQILSDSLEYELEKIFKESPYYKATSADVDWVAKVKMQGEVQKWIDHSISVTVNLPEFADEETVAKVYETAWKEGCKGITVYREGSRTGVLISNKVEEKPKHELIKRPEVIDADVIRFKNGTDEWISFVGLVDNKPFEIFTGKYDIDEFPVPKSIKKGQILKVKGEDGITRYDFRYTDKYGYTNILGGLSRIFDKEFWNYARMISGFMRHGVEVISIINIVDGMKFDHDSISSWKSGIMRTLKTYVPEGTEDTNPCPECGGKIIYESGCASCKDCGYSKCG